MKDRTVDQGVRAVRRRLLALLGVGVGARWSAVESAQAAPRLKVLIKSAWGSNDPTQASFPFHHANAFAAGGHEVQIFLLGEAVTVMRTVVANAIVPVGWPPLDDALKKTIANKIPIHV